MTQNQLELIQHLPAELQRIIENSLASFELENITITDEMIKDAIMVLSVESAETELILKYLDDGRRFIVASFMHDFLEYHSAEHGCYYAKWISEESFILVDKDDQICVNQSIYQLLGMHQKSYKFKISDDLICHLCDF